MTRKDVEKLKNEHMLMLRKRLIRKLHWGYITKLEYNQTGKWITRLFETAYGLGRADEAGKSWSAWNSNLADNGWMDHTCVKCGFNINTDVHVYVDYGFCPGCGSPMINGKTFSEDMSSQKEIYPYIDLK